MRSFLCRCLFVVMTLFVLDAAAAPTAFKVEVTGTGKPIILIPGLVSSGEVWKETVARYCGRHQCHVLNLAGFAGVPPIEEPLLASVDRQLADYVEANRLERPVLVGHSLGGFVALRFAANHPDKVSRLVIVDTLPSLGAIQVPDLTPEQLKGAAARFRDAMRKQDEKTYAANRHRIVESMVTKPADVERVYGWGTDSDRATSINAMYDLMSTDLRPELARIKVPTLVLGTWIGWNTPREAAESTFKSQYQHLEGVKIELADKARHFIMYDDPAWMFERMDAFLGNT